MHELPPIGGPGLRILFVGINPSLRSGETGHHFAGPSNRFWSTLHAAGLTPQRLRPEQDAELPRYGLGLTNLVARATRAASEVTAEELRAGGQTLTELVADWAPRLVAIVGVTAYRVAFARPKAATGRQPNDAAIAARPVWVLPNPSGLNAHYRPADFARAYAEAWIYADRL